MESLEQNISLVKAEIIKEFFDPFENEELKNFIILNSKFIRSKFVMLYLKTLGFNINSDIIKILAIGEIIHSASLLHDDVIDNAESRRGEKTIGELHSSKISILAGDYLLAYAIEKLQDLNNNKILKLFKDCTKNMVKAEFKQYFLRKQIPTFDVYIDICKGKTANLFSTILESCCFILNLNSQQGKVFSEKFGIYFQLKNDLEKESEMCDKRNEIYTLKDIVGVEKSFVLLDNYKEELKELLFSLPNNNYREILEDLINLV